MRFENDLTGSIYSIESLANVSKLSNLGIGLPSSKTAVDHFYFDFSSSTTDCNIEGLNQYSWFYLDSGHLGFYQATCV